MGHSIVRSMQWMKAPYVKRNRNKELPKLPSRRYTGVKSRIQERKNAFELGQLLLTFSGVWCAYALLNCEKLYNGGTRSLRHTPDRSSVSFTCFTMEWNLPLPCSLMSTRINVRTSTPQQLGWRRARFFPAHSRIKINDFSLDVYMR